MGEQLVDVAALALQHLDDLAGQLLTSLGDSAANSGLNPLNSTVRSSAGWVRAQRDRRAVGAARPAAPAPWVSAT